MLLQKKAAYNLLQLNLRLDDGVATDKLQPWQLVNYRDFPLERLLEELATTQEAFEACATKYDTPEEMIDDLGSALTPLERDHTYLILFELWRRLFPERQSLSIFCDELDHQIYLYDNDQPSQVGDLLTTFQCILDENVDAGTSPKDALTMMQSYCANDLESFLLDYILDQLDTRNRLYARELVDGLGRYITQEKWLEYFHGRLEKDLEKRIAAIEALTKKTLSLDLAFELVSYLQALGETVIFPKFAAKTLGQIETGEDFEEFLQLCHFEPRSFCEESVKEVQKILRG